MARKAKVEPGDLWETIVAGAVAFAAIYTILWLLGVSISGDAVIWMFFGFIFFGFLVRNTVDVTVGFALTTLAVIVALTVLLPSWVSQPFMPLVEYVEGLLGADIGPIDPLGFGVVAVVFTFLMIAARYKITGKKKFVRPIVDSTLAEMARYMRVYLNIGRLVVLLSFAAIVFSLQQSAVALGVAGEVVADVPMVAANFVTVLAGYLSLGGGLPVIGTLPLLGDLTAAGFLVFALLVIGAAAMARWEGSGPLTQFLRNRGS